MGNEIMQCPIPENEAQRLEAVRSYEILDSSPEVDFDALTRVAAFAFDAPAAVVGLMDSDRLWFKSHFGLDVPQLDRQIAFCAHAVMKPNELLVIEDLAEDTRFSRNPLVVNAPNLRFYAGAPLVDHKGYALGTIAVVDVKPRKFSETQRHVLRDLSKLVMTALDNRRRALLLSRMARTDHLTGLANRADFDDVLSSQMAHTARTGETFALLYMDLDGFKMANDHFGHATGDEVLREVARRLSQQVREQDALARIGGDEFGVVIRGGTLESAQMLAKRIDHAVSAPIGIPGGGQVSIGISIGIATYCDSSEPHLALLERADRELYQAKRVKRERN
ncbi:MAG: sensor domain-containing diguanylate cyclase [Nitrosomonadales bacterium]|nr:sensor domain-containing diguanylate cyclase [Nitrosomonadales bacterium]